MANPDRLTGLDSSFLHLERDAAHMHMAGCMVFEGKAPSYPELVDQIGLRLHLVPRYRQRLAFVPLDRGRPVWVDDPHFNLTYHVRHTALPRPGAEGDLKRLAGRIFSQALDRNRPLWELWLVEGLDGGRFALSVRPIMRSSTGFRASTSPRCCSTPRRTRCPSRSPRASGSHDRCRRRRSCWQMRWSSVGHPRAKWCEACARRCADLGPWPSGLAGRSRASERWPGRDSRRRRRARSTCGSGRTAGSPGFGAISPSSRRSRTRSAAPSTT